MDLGFNPDFKQAKKKKRTTKAEKETHQTYICDYDNCGKQYLSQAALYTHKKNKNNNLQESNYKNTDRGRPRVFFPFKKKKF